MRNFLLLCLCLFSISVFSQDNFNYNEGGLSPEFVVVEIEGKTQKEIFDKAVNWIKETYKNPDEVIKTTIENEKVRFEGFTDNLICVTALGSTSCYGATYTIEIEFKEGKYKFTPLELTYRVPPTQYTSNMNVLVNFSSGKDYYNKKGEVRKMYNAIPEAIQSHFNALNQSLKGYVKEEGSSDDW